MRLMRMERELGFVRSDRDRNELYLMRILKEVDQKVRGAGEYCIVICDTCTTGEPTIIVVRTKYGV